MLPPQRVTLTVFFLSVWFQDADLIEILWKQDIDLGIPRDLFRATPASDQVGDHLVQDLLLNEKYNAKVCHPRQQPNLREVSERTFSEQKYKKDLSLVPGHTIAHHRH